MVNSLKGIKRFFEKEIFKAFLRKSNKSGYSQITPRDTNNKRNNSSNNDYNGHNYYHYFYHIQCSCLPTLNKYIVFGKRNTTKEKRKGGKNVDLSNR